MATKSNTKTPKAPTAPSHVYSETYDVDMGTAGRRLFQIADPSTPIPVPEGEPATNAMGQPVHICQVEGCKKLFWGRFVTTFCNPCWTWIKVERQRTGYRAPRGGGGSMAAASRIADLEKQLADANAKLAKAPTKPAAPKKKVATKPAATTQAADTTQAPAATTDAA